MGVMGLYVGRVYEEVKSRPLYIVRNTLGIADVEVLREHAQTGSTFEA
jgi:hypothetical protein